MKPEPTRHPSPAGQARPTDPARLTPSGASPDAAEGEEASRPPRAGSNEALNEERRTRPSRNRGVTDV